MCPPERPNSGVSIPRIHALCVGNERWMCPCRATRAGTQAPPLPISVIHLRAIPHKQNNHLHTIHPNETNHPHAIYPNETVGAVPVCPPERPNSGVSIPRIHALCVGNERWMCPCRATRAGTQAPPLPIPVIFFHAIPHKQNNHLRTIISNDINRPRIIHPNETRKQSTHTSGAKMHRALPPPFFEIKKCVYVMI